LYPVFQLTILSIKPNNSGNSLDERTTMLRLRSLALIGAAVTVSLLSSALVASSPAVAATPGQPIPASQVRPLTTAAPMISGSNHSLNGVSCPDASFCMAVGNYDLGARVPGLSEMLSAGSWTAEPVPSPGRGPNVFANEVSCSSATSCLLVGAHWAGSHGADSNLAEAWNGSKWHIVTATGPAGTSYSSLNDVACPASNLCLAVGEAGSAHAYQSSAYTLRDGTTWRQVRMPHPRGARSSALGGLACSDTRHCTAVGDYTSAAGRFLPFADIWRNGSWRLLAVPAVRGERQTVFEGITCPLATKCVAVGYAEDNTRGRYFHALADVWNGGRWHLSTLRRAPSVFVGASCPVANRCFATGYTFPSVRGYAHQLIEAWNGSAWAAQRPAQTSGLGGSLQHVSCVSTVSCETVGFAFFPNAAKSDEAISEVWNGHGWTGQVTPNP
jgi:hypothetical protein